jgi:hypothetical protein
MNEQGIDASHLECVSTQTTSRVDLATNKVSGQTFWRQWNFGQSLLSN